MKTDIDIQKWVYRKIKQTALFNAVTGILSDRGRPNKSEAEDIVISILANDGMGQVQTAFVNVNIYVKDLWNSKTNNWERDTVRVNELCKLSKALFEMQEKEFFVSASNSAQRVMPTGVQFEDGHTEHFINNKLYLKICND